MSHEIHTHSWRSGKCSICGVPEKESSENKSDHDPVAKAVNQLNRDVSGAIGQLTWAMWFVGLIVFLILARLLNG